MHLDINTHDQTGYGLDHLPLAIMGGTDNQAGHVVTRVGDTVIDLAALGDLGVNLGLTDTTTAHPTDRTDDPWHANSLNALFATGHEAMARLRDRISTLATQTVIEDRLGPAFRSIDEVTLLLPIDCKNYVDFYSSLQHATNLGRLFRPNGDPLTPNWRHLPIGYHGRSSTVVVSDTPVRRPCGLRIVDNKCVFGPSLRLDIEAEVGFVVGRTSTLGTAVKTEEFFDYVAGVVLVNDWSARDIQSFEYQPLGPFLGKSFLTSISAWVTPLEALTSARTTPVTQDPIPADYLVDTDPWNLAIELEVELNDTLISHPPFATTYWTPGQQLAHQTVNGADVRVGDLFASGTVSGEHPNQYGSLIELTNGGSQPLTLSDHSTRGFLDDGDTVTIRASAPSLRGNRLSLGEVRGTIVGQG